MVDPTQEREYGTITQDQLAERLLLHRKLLSGDSKEGRRLELNAVDLTELDLDGRDISQGIFRRVRLCGYVFHGRSLAHCQFEGCDLTGARFNNVDLTEAIFKSETILDNAVFATKKLAGVRFAQVSLNATNFQGCQCPAAEGGSVVFEQCDGVGTDFHGADLGHVCFNSVRLRGSDFSDATLIKAIIRKSSSVAKANFKRAHLRDLQVDQTEILESDFANADLTGAQLRASSFANTDFQNARWEDATLEDVTIDGACFSRGLNLYGRHGLKCARVTGARRARYSPKWDLCSWGLIRSVGSIPLFGVSYTAIIAIWLWAHGAEWYNKQVTALQTQEGVHERIPWINELAQFPVTRDMGYLLAAIIILAVGATIYRFWCPRIVQEHTDTQWEYVLRHEVFEYWIHGYSLPVLRWASALCYLVGGGWVFVQLSIKVYGALVFLFST